MKTLRIALATGLVTVLLLVAGIWFLNNTRLGLEINCRFLNDFGACFRYELSAPETSTESEPTRVFPAPVLGQAVYDKASVLSAAVEGDLESRIDAIEARSGAEVVLYVQVDPEATEESNLEAARTLMGEWGIGRSGINDGFVILVSFQEDLLHGKLSTFAGAGLLGPLSPAEQGRLRDDVMLPAFLAGNVEEGIVLGIAFVDGAIP